MNPNDMPKLPRENLVLPARRARDMKPGERGVLMASFGVKVDEDLHVWIDGDQTVMEGGALAKLTVQVERTENGFILWLDTKTTFKPEKSFRRGQCIPVVEFRQAKEEDR